MASGYRILERRYKTPVGEIDLIIANARRLAFVEVKGRADVDKALGAVSLRQQQRIKRAASHWLAKRGGQITRDIGFDVIAITPWRFPRHQKDAFPTYSLDAALATLQHSHPDTGHVHIIKGI